MSEKKPFLSTSELVSIGFASVVVALLALFGAPDLITIPISVFTVGWVGFAVIRNHMRKEA
ncbi:hypothetical protein [Nocardiopsis sp. NPDC058789]|uniref:hypothetical protein n=1 Tax=Nocardiopsis TaxID=2013 RepID=UPI00366CE398